MISSASCNLSRGRTEKRQRLTQRGKWANSQWGSLPARRLYDATIAPQLTTQPLRVPGHLLTPIARLQNAYRLRSLLQGLLKCRSDGLAPLLERAGHLSWCRARWCCWDNCARGRSHLFLNIHDHDTPRIRSSLCLFHQDRDVVVRLPRVRRDVDGLSVAGEATYGRP